MPTFDIYQAKTPSPGTAGYRAPAASSGTSLTYLLGPIVPGGSAVDEIDLGAGSGLAGSAGAGLFNQLYLVYQIAGVTGTGTLTLVVTVETADDTAFGTNNVVRFTTPTVSSVQNSALNLSRQFALPYLPQRYARIGITPGGTTPAWTIVAAITDNMDSRFTL